MIKIKAIDLVEIVVAAEIWFKRQKQLTDISLWEKSRENATSLKKQLYKTNWDEDAELIIEEAPF